MRIGPGKAGVLALLCAAAAAHAGAPAEASTGDTTEAAATAASPVLPPDARVEGLSYGAWTGRWWQWAKDQVIAPYRDPDGRFCDLGQEGPVWFLAGTDGSFNAHRQCVVPAGKYVLVPVINMYHSGEATADDGVEKCRQLQAGAAVNNDHLVSAVVLVDGIPVADVARYRVRSDGCFTMSSDLVHTRLAASDGYWILLRPLRPGRHTISIGANYGTDDEAFGRMLQNFEYELDVGGRSDLAGVGFETRVNGS